MFDGTSVLESAATGGMQATAEPVTVSVIVPTYHEAENLPAVIPAACEALAGADLAAEIIVVDDDSRDGTEALIQRLSPTYPVRILDDNRKEHFANTSKRSIQIGCLEDATPIE